MRLTGPLPGRIPNGRLPRLRLRRCAPLLERQRGLGALRRAGRRGVGVVPERVGVSRLFGLLALACCGGLLVLDDLELRSCSGGQRTWGELHLGAANAEGACGLRAQRAHTGESVDGVVDADGDRPEGVADQTDGVADRNVVELSHAHRDCSRGRRRLRSTPAGWRRAAPAPVRAHLPSRAAAGWEACRRGSCSSACRRTAPGR